MRNKDTILLENAYEKVLNEHSDENLSPSFYRNRLKPEQDRKLDVELEQSLPERLRWKYQDIIPQSTEVTPEQEKVVNDMVKRGWEVIYFQPLTEFGMQEHKGGIALKNLRRELFDHNVTIIKPDGEVDHNSNNKRTNNLRDGMPI